MRKRTWLFMLLCALLGLSLIIVFFQFVRFSRTWYVPKDYSTIQIAINNAAEGDTVKVASGTYNEHIVVNKSISLIGEDRDSTVIDGKGTGTVVHITANNVHISQFTIQNGGSNYGESGISLSHVSHGTIRNNRIVNCGYDGVLMVGATYNDVSHNIILNNKYIGIVLHRSNNNVINENTASFNGWTGIELQISENNVITKNVAQNNTYGIRFLNDEPPLGKNNTLRFNQMLANKYNFGFHRATKNYTEGFIQNIDTSNTVNGKPVYYLLDATNQTIDSTTLPNIGYLAVVNSRNITVRNLYLSNNINGILLAYTDNSILENLTLAYNEEGVKLIECEDNRIYHNNFINNSQQATSYNSNNRWDDAYPSGGNYWSDYKGVDNYSGQNQDLLGSDGRGDTPYNIDANNSDRYPLIGPYQ